MANQTGSGNLTGTADDDIIIGVGSNQTINGLAGNDVLIGDHGDLFVDTGAGNNSIGTAIDIDYSAAWSTLPNPDIGYDSVPYTTIMATGAGERDYFKVTVGIGETITLDVDYAHGNFGGPSFDSAISLRDAADVQIPGAFNDDGDNEIGGLGSYSISNFDSYLTYTNNTGSIQTYYIRVEQLGTGVISGGRTYLLNVSVTNHANANVNFPGIDTINGGDDDDIIYGLEGNDILNGDAGHDIIEGGLGADMMDGGAGNDTVSYSSSSAAVNIDLYFNTYSGGDAAGDTLSNFENIVGSAFNDFLRAGSTGTFIILGREGDDAIASGGPTSVGEFYGGAGNDNFDFQAGYNATGYIFDGGADTDTLRLFGPGASTDFRSATINSIETLNILGEIGSNREVIFNANQFTMTYVTNGVHVGQTHQVSLFMDTATTLDLSGVTFFGFTEPGDQVNITGDGDNETITGSIIRDNIVAGGGDDTLNVGSTGIVAGETYDGGLGTGDELNFTALSTAHTVNLQTDVFDLVAGGAASTVSNIEIVRAGSGDDVLIGGSSANNYSLFGGMGDDRVGPGTFLIAAGDVFDGGDGTDTLDFASQTNSLFNYGVNLATNQFVLLSNEALATAVNFENIDAGDGDDFLAGDDGINIINGGGGNDFIEGGGGSDTINGGDGDDALNGGTGVDTVDGGAGIDTINLYEATNTQKVNLITNVNIGGFAHNDTFLNIENVFGSNTRGDDITGTTGVNALYGFGADDRLRGHNGDDILNGGEGNDFLYGGNGADTMDGGNGNDWVMYNGLTTGVKVFLIYGFGLGGQADFDIYTSIERVRGSLGDDTISGTDGINKLLGDGGNDTINGMGGKDVIRGGDGDDIINGGAGNDGLRGDAGSDTFIFEFGSGHDFVIDFENNIDTLNIDDALYGGGLTIAELVNDHMVMENATRFHFDFGGGDVLHVLTTTVMGLSDFYDDVTIV